MKQPLIIINGLIQSAENEKVQILRLNIGPSEPVLVTSTTVNINRSLSHLIPSGSNKVKTILGGEEGDVLVLTGDNVRLRKGGNIAQRNLLVANKALVLIFVAGVWIELK